MDRYRVQRISGGSMDELESNLRTFLDGLKDDEECISLSLGLKEALIVTGKRKGPVTTPEPVPVPTPPPTTPLQHTYDIPVQPPQPMPGPGPQQAPQMERPATGATEPEVPKTVQFIPKVEKTQDADDVVDVVSESPSPEGAPQRADLIFRKCSFCDKQLIVPHVPISVMCPHCKATVSIDE